MEVFSADQMSISTRDSIWFFCVILSLKNQLVLIELGNAYQLSGAPDLLEANETLLRYNGLLGILSAFVFSMAVAVARANKQVVFVWGYALLLPFLGVLILQVGFGLIIPIPSPYGVYFAAVLGTLIMTLSFGSLRRYRHPSAV